MPTINTSSAANTIKPPFTLSDIHAQYAYSVAVEMYNQIRKITADIRNSLIPFPPLSAATVSITTPPPFILNQTVQTAGGGDCAFHSIFGTKLNNIYTCSDVSEKRQAFVAWLKDGEKHGPDIAQLIHECIRDLITGDPLPIGFEEQSYPHIMHARQQNKARQDIDVTQEILEEYYQWVEGMGHWMLRGEIALIAYAFNITIIGQAGGPYNPGQTESINIGFNGSHYERIETLAPSIFYDPQITPILETVNLPSESTIDKLQSSLAELQLRNKQKDMQVLYRMLETILEWEKNEHKNTEEAFKIVSSLAGGRDGITVKKNDLECIRKRYGRNRHQKYKYGFINFTQLHRAFIVLQAHIALPEGIASDLKILKSKIVFILHHELQQHSPELPPLLAKNDYALFQHLPHTGAESQLNAIYQYTQENYYRISINRIKAELNFLKEVRETKDDLYFVARKLIIIGELCHEIKEDLQNIDQASMKKLEPFTTIGDDFNALRNMFVHLPRNFMKEFMEKENPLREKLNSEIALLVNKLMENLKNEDAIVSQLIEATKPRPPQAEKTKINTEVAKKLRKAEEVLKVSTEYHELLRFCREQNGQNLSANEQESISLTKEPLIPTLLTIADKLNAPILKINALKMLKAKKLFEKLIKHDEKCKTLFTATTQKLREENIIKDNEEFDITSKVHCSAFLDEIAFLTTKEWKVQKLSYKNILSRLEKLDQIYPAIVAKSQDKALKAYIDNILKQLKGVSQTTADALAREMNSNDIHTLINLHAKTDEEKDKEKLEDLYAKITKILSYIALPIDTPPTWKAHGNIPPQLVGFLASAYGAHDTRPPKVLIERDRKEASNSSNNLLVRRSDTKSEVRLGDAHVSNPSSTGLTKSILDETIVSNPEKTSADIALQSENLPNASSIRHSQMSAESKNIDDIVYLLSRIEEEMTYVLSVDERVTDSLKRQAIKEYVVTLIGQYMRELSEIASLKEHLPSHTAHEAGSRMQQLRSKGLAHEILRFDPAQFEGDFRQIILPATEDFRAINSILQYEKQPSQTVQAFHRLGNDFRRLCLYDVAISCFTIAIDLINIIGERNIDKNNQTNIDNSDINHINDLVFTLRLYILTIYCSLAQTYQEKGDYQNAYKTAREIIEEVATIDMSNVDKHSLDWLAHSWVIIGNYELSIAQTAKAVLSFKTAYEFASDSTLKNNILYFLQCCQQTASQTNQTTVITENLPDYHFTQLSIQVYFHQQISNYYQYLHQGNLEEAKKILVVLQSLQSESLHQFKKELGDRYKIYELQIFCAGIMYQAKIQPTEKEISSLEQSFQSKLAELPEQLRCNPENSTIYTNFSMIYSDLAESQVAHTSAQRLFLLSEVQLAKAADILPKNDRRLVKAAKNFSIRCYNYQRNMVQGHFKLSLQVLKPALIINQKYELEIQAASILTALGFTHEQQGEHVELQGNLTNALSFYKEATLYLYQAKTLFEKYPQRTPEEQNDYQEAIQGLGLCYERSSKCLISQRANRATCKQYLEKAIQFYDQFLAFPHIPQHEDRVEVIQNREKCIRVINLISPPQINTNEATVITFNVEEEKAISKILIEHCNKAIKEKRKTILFKKIKDTQLFIHFLTNKVGITAEEITVTQQGSVLVKLSAQSKNLIEALKKVT